MIRVVHVLTRTNIGGPSVMLVDLLRGLDDSRYEQIVVRGPANSNEGDYLEQHPVASRVITLPQLRRAPGVLRELAALLALTRILYRLRPDIVHTHMAKAGVIGRLAGMLARVPVRIHTFHGHLLHGYFPSVVNRAIVVAERILQRITTYFLVVGTTTRDDLMLARVVTGKRSAMVLPGARSLQRLDSMTARTRLGLPVDAVIVGYLGRFTDIKRPDRFIELARSLPDAHFLMVGNGPQWTTVQHEASRLGNVTLLDWTSDLPLVLGALDVLVLTSDNEGVPLSLMEAATAGVPVVSMKVGSVQDIVVNELNGLLARDENELRSAVERLIESGDLRETMGQAGRKLVEERCSMEHYLRTHAALYERLVARRRNGGSPSDS